mgnify:CR=1 FL=1
MSTFEVTHVSKVENFIQPEDFRSESKEYDKQDLIGIVRTKWAKMSRERKDCLIGTLGRTPNGKKNWEEHYILMIYETQEGKLQIRPGILAELYTRLKHAKPYLVKRWLFVNTEGRTWDFVPYKEREGADYFDAPRSPLNFNTILWVLNNICCRENGPCWRRWREYCIQTEKWAKIVPEGGWNKDTWEDHPLAATKVVGGSRSAPKSHLDDDRESYFSHTYVAGPLVGDPKKILEYQMPNRMCEWEVSF